jgi:hypothetical protein
MSQTNFPATSVHGGLLMNIDLSLVDTEVDTGPESREEAQAPRSDLSAATGIVTGLAISAGLWAVIGSVVRILLR